jgi:hypothetical protein
MKISTKNVDPPGSGIVLRVLPDTLRLAAPTVTSACGGRAFQDSTLEWNTIFPK